MSKLGTLSSFSIKKRYMYGMADISKKLNGVEYEIFIDPINSGTMLNKNGKKLINPKKVKYGAMVNLSGGSYGLGRNFATKSDAKKKLDYAYTLLSKEKEPISKRAILRKISKY